MSFFHPFTTFASFESNFLQAAGISNFINFRASEEGGLRVQNNSTSPCSNFVLHLHEHSRASPHSLIASASCGSIFAKLVAFEFDFFDCHAANGWYKLYFWLHPETIEWRLHLRNRVDLITERETLFCHLPKHQQSISKMSLLMLPFACRLFCIIHFFSDFSRAHKRFLCNKKKSFETLINGSQHSEVKAKLASNSTNENTRMESSGIFTADSLSSPNWKR